MTAEERADRLVAMWTAGWGKISKDAFRQSILQSIREAEQARDERAAKIVGAECERVLALQKPDADPLSVDASVNLNLRLGAVLLPEIAAAIRAADK